MLPAFLITLREGLEAALIVSILGTYVVRTGRRGQLRPIWVGVAAALAASLAVGLAVALGTTKLSFKAQEAFEGTASLLAVAVLTWMIFWMRRQARSIKGSLEQKADSAITSGSAVALPLLAFTAVGREGLETVLFLYAAFGSSASPAASGGGAVAGLVVSSMLGYGIYKGGVRLNLRTFFQVTGGLIIVVAAGLLASAVHEFNEAGMLLVLTDPAWDVSGIVGSSSVLGSVLRGMFGYEPEPTVLQVIVYWVYLVPALIGFYGVPGFLRRRAEAVSPEAA